MGLKGVVRGVVKVEVAVATTAKVDGARNIMKLSSMFIQDGSMSRGVGHGRMSCIALSEVAESLFHHLLISPVNHEGDIRLLTAASSGRPPAPEHLPICVRSHYYL